MAFGVPSIGRRVGAAALLALIACTPRMSPDSYELRNMDPANIVPKSSPQAFVAAFSAYCLDPKTPAAARAKLRAGSYVPAPRKLGAMEVWLVDDRRPAVLLNETDCAVLAQSRTGQTERVKTLVAKQFPQAVPLSDARFESLWQVPGAKQLIFTKRSQPNQPESHFMLGITRGE